MKFLEREREAVARLAESQPIKKFPRQQYHTSANDGMTKQWRTLHEILGGGGGASASGLVRFICPSYAWEIRGHAPTGKF